MLEISFGRAVIRVGFYPGDGKKGSGTGVIVINDKPKKGAKKSNSIDISPDARRDLTDDIHEGAVNRENGDGKEYELDGFNCADWIVDLINEHVIPDRGASPFTKPTPGMTTPRQVREWIDTQPYSRP